ncbi:MAG: WbqC family protein [Paracoccaceae bacterium]
MHIAIMQPYFLPYLGYFQLIATVDRFVIYDNVEYTKKGWINRNRILRNGEPVLFTLPLGKGSDYLDVRDRTIASSFDPTKLLGQFAGAYRNAPHFDAIMPYLSEILQYSDRNLFAFVRHSLEVTCRYLGIATPLLVSSEIEKSSHLHGSDRVISICEQLGADRYTNPIGGLLLYRPSDFAARGITLRFLRSRPDPYLQGGATFQPYLSIVDVMMFNSRDQISMMLTNGYDIVEGSDV